MAEVTAALVNELRKRTDMPLMECKKALVETSGDVEKAILYLREKMKNVTVKPAEAGEATEGRIAVLVDTDKKVGAIVEIHCRTAPSAKTDQFIALTKDVARHAAFSKGGTPEQILKEPLNGGSGQTVADRIQEVVGLIREEMKLARFARFEGLCGGYAHHDGTKGVLLLVDGDKAEPQLLRDVCMHITACAPVAGTREEISAERVEQERQLAKNKALATGKPAQIADKIAEGMLNTWFGENVLLEQPFVKDPTKKVGDLLKAAGVKFNRYVRYQIGG